METTTNGLRFPDAPDPGTIWTYFQNLAEDTDNLIASTTGRFAMLPTGDTITNSRILTGADVRCAQTDTTTLLTVTFSLASTQYVAVSGKARFEADSTSSAQGDVALCILVDGTIGGDLPNGLAQAGPAHVSSFSNTGRTSLAIPTFYITLGGGSHTIALQADRDNTGVLNATADASINGRSYHPTSLTITV